jgi:hypothetical protein
MWRSKVSSSRILIKRCILDAIDKFHSRNDFGEVVKSSLPPPVVLRTFGQLEDPVQYAVTAQIAI